MRNHRQVLSGLEAGRAGPAAARQHAPQQLQPVHPARYPCAVGTSDSIATVTTASLTSCTRAQLPGTTRNFSFGPNQVSGPNGCGRAFGHHVSWVQLQPVSAAPRVNCTHRHAMQRVLAMGTACGTKQRMTNGRAALPPVPWPRVLCHGHGAAAAMQTGPVEPSQPSGPEAT